MIESIFLMLVGFIFVIFILNLFKKSVGLAVLTTLAFFIIAMLAMQIQIPYSHIDSSDVVQNGFQVISDYAASMICILFGIGNAVLVVIYRAEQIEKEKDEGGED